MGEHGQVDQLGRQIGIDQLARVLPIEGELGQQQHLKAPSGMYFDFFVATMRSYIINIAA